jgi:hypothetical protein
MSSYPEALQDSSLSILATLTSLKEWISVSYHNISPESFPLLLFQKKVHALLGPCSKSPKLEEKAVRSSLQIV